MIHLLDKLSAGQLGLLFTILGIAACITICSVFHSLAVAVRGHPPLRPLSEHMSSQEAGEGPE